MHSTDALVYLLFVLMATVIWFFNAFSTRRTVTLTIPVTYTHMPEDYIFVNPPVDHIRISLEDEGIDLFHNRERQYTLSFDLSDYIHGEEDSFVIPLDDVRQAIAQQLVGDAALLAFAPEVITGSYTRQHEKQVPVIYTGHVKPAAQHQLCGEAEIHPRIVHVYGNEQVLHSIERVETYPVDYEGVQDTFRTRLALVCPPGVRLMPDSVQLSVVSELFTERTMVLPIRTPDLSASGRTLHLFPEQASVTLRIGTAWFNTISEQDIHVYVDAPKATTDRLTVHVESTNPHITHLRVKPQEVEYLIERYETLTDGGSAAPVPED